MNKRAQVGEIASILTLLSLVAILVGTFLGTQQAVQKQVHTLFSRAQTASCPFRSQVTIYKDQKGGEQLSQAELDSFQWWGVSNDLQSQTEAAHKFLTTPTRQRFDQENLTNKRTNATVKLFKPADYNIIETGCSSNPFTPVSGCPNNMADQQTNQTITGFNVDCYVDIEYYWVVRKPGTPPPPTATVAPTAIPLTSAPTAVPPTTPPTGGPTVRPSATTVPTAPRCSYYTTASVRKNSVTGPLLRKSEIVAPAWGLSNNKRSQTQPFDHFGLEALRQFNYDNFPFLPETPNAQYRRGDPASVRLFGLEGSNWVVTDRFCRNRTGRVGCPASATTNTDLNVISGFTVDCGVDLEYGWVVSPKPSPTPTTTPPSQQCNAEVHFIVDSSKSVIRQFTATMSRLGSVLRDYRTSNPNRDISFSLQYFSTYLSPNHSIGSVSQGITSPLPRPQDQQGTNIKEALSQGIIANSTNVFVSDGVPTVVKYSENGTNATCGYSVELMRRPNYQDLTPDGCVIEGTTTYVRMELCSREVKQICGSKTYRQANEDSKSGKADFSVLVHTGGEDANFMQSVAEETIELDDLPGKFNRILDSVCREPEPTPTPNRCRYYAETFVRECLRQNADGSCVESRPITDYDLADGSIIKGDYGAANNKQQQVFGDRPMIEHPFPSTNTRIDRSIPGEIRVGDRNADITTAFIGGVGDNSDNLGYAKTGEYANPIKLFLNRIDRTGTPEFGWNIVGQFCQSNTLEDGCGPNNVKSFNIPAPINHPELINNVKVQCGTDVRYGWYVVKDGFAPAPNGDINKDKVINSLDAAACIAQWARSETLLPKQKTCDINRDDKVNSLDYSFVFGIWRDTNIFSPD